MRGHDHPLGNAVAELEDSLFGCLWGDAFLVGSRRPVAEPHRPKPVDLDHDLLLEAREELAHFIRVVRLHPLLPLGLGDVLEDGTVRVAAHEAGAEATYELEGLVRQRPPREVAAEDDQVGLSLLDLGEGGLERRCVPVDIREDGDALHCRTSTRLNVALRREARGWCCVTSVRKPRAETRT